MIDEDRLVQMQYVLRDLYRASGVFRFRSFSADLLLIYSPVFLLAEDAFVDSVFW